MVVVDDFDEGFDFWLFFLFGFGYVVGDFVGVMFDIGNDGVVVGVVFGVGVNGLDDDNL